VYTQIRSFKGPDTSTIIITLLLITLYLSLNMTTPGNTSLNTSAETPQRTDTPFRASRRTTGLNDTLHTQYIDIPDEDTSLYANTTRCISGLVGTCFTPRQILIVLRLLKTLTFFFLIFTLVADMMFIFFVNLKVSHEVNTKVGGSRDTIIRIYGLVLTVIALSIELDVSSIVKHFSGVKSFIPRSFLLFFIATITASSPMHESSLGRSQSSNSNNDDAYGYDDTYSSSGRYSDQQVSQEIPSSTVVFQMVASIIL
jgi:hypothetical protein